MKKIFLTVSSVLLSLSLYSQSFKGLDEFEEIPLPSNHDTLVEYRKVYAISPYIGAQYFYAMPSTSENISIIFNFTKDILELNGGDIEKPTHNHNESGEVWITDDGFEAMSQQTVNYYKMVRREYFIEINEEEKWYVQFEVFNGHVFFRSGEII